MIIGLLLGGAAGASARPFSEGCKWSYYHLHKFVGVNVFEASFHKYELKGTYELNGKTYTKMYSSYYYDGYEPGEGFLIGVREENGCVYADYDEFIQLYWGHIPELLEDDIYGMRYVVTPEREVVIYNFNLNVGDFLVQDSVINPQVVDSITSIELKTGEVRELYNTNRGDIISGIGSVNFYGTLLDYLVEDYFVPTDGWRQSHLNMYYENDTLVYKAPDRTPDWGVNPYGTYLTDPFFDKKESGIKDVKAEQNTACEAAVYDLGGRRMGGALKPGVYIRGGKKIVIK